MLGSDPAMAVHDHPERRDRRESDERVEGGATGKALHWSANLSGGKGLASLRRRSLETTLRNAHRPEP